MHQYMKSIGFGNITRKKKLKQILKDVEESLHNIRQGLRVHRMIRNGSL